MKEQIFVLEATMSVSFIHTGDLHLGRLFHFNQRGSVFGKEKRLDLWETFEKILNTAEKNQIDLLLISGDLFDSAEVDLTEVQRVAEWFKRLEHTQIVMICGNHDRYSDYSLYGLVDWPDNVTLFKEDRLASVYIESLNTEIYGMSWTKGSYTEMPFTFPALNPDHENILMLHGDAYAKDSDYLPVSVKQLEDFDYVALGHIHKSEYLTEKAAYCGSPESLSFGEIGDHGIIFGIISEHRCQSRFISTQKRQYRNVRIEIRSDMSLDDVKAAVLSCDDEANRMTNYYRFYLEGYRDPNFSLEWLKEELNRCFYYYEIIDDDLQIDLDVDLLLAQNKNNLIGRFIQEIRREDDTPMAKKALYYGLECIMKEKGTL